MSEQSESTAEPAPEEEHVGRREVYVTRDEGGITSLSEVKEGADPRVTAGDDGDDGKDDDDGDGGNRDESDEDASDEEDSDS